MGAESDGLDLPYLAVAALASAAASAQSIWPERAENLQVLPDDVPPQRLRAVMMGFPRVDVPGVGYSIRAE